MSGEENAKGSDMSEDKREIHAKFGDTSNGRIEESPIEAPIAVKVSTPSTVMAEHAQQAADGYFTAQPAASELQRHPVLPVSEPVSPNDAATPLAPNGTKTGEVFVALNALERPAAHSRGSSMSVQSTDSSATVIAASSAPVLTPSGRTRPEFPNQAYSALQTQQYPARRAPPSFKQRGTHPGQIFTFTSALASQHHAGGARVIGKSAPVTPGVGLFTLPQHPSSSEWESTTTPGTYASPFLHFTQRTQPKETYVADVDVDPISGRKLVNHYEILDELGRGTHGKVKLGRDLSTDTYVAIKIVDRFSKRRKLGRLGTTEDKAKKEVAILKQVRHPNVTALLEVIDDPTRKKVYLVLEWVELGQIEWRVKGAKEVVAVEARRYEREKKYGSDCQLDAEDAAVLVEAQKRLARQRQRQARTFRKIYSEAGEASDNFWSNEIAGDEESEISDDDKLSRISTESYSSRVLDGRRSSRAPSPLPPVENETGTRPVEFQARYLQLTSEPQAQSPPSMTSVYTGLEGTMYGPYIPHPVELPTRRRGNTSSDNLKQMAVEVLDGEMNDELSYVPMMTIQQARVAFRDTLIGLQYLHYQGIIHRDIKPPNLLSTREHRVKISDFGVSYLGQPKAEGEAVEDVSEHDAKDLDDGAKELAKTVGTPAFYAPELCITEATEDAPPITGAIDVWALGVTLFCMLFARTPFVDNEFVVMRQIAEEEIYLPKMRLKPVEGKTRSRPSSQRRTHQPAAIERRHDLELAYEEIDSDLHDLMRRMLEKDPRKRITLDEVRHHPWVVADIHDKLKWLEETDPSRQSQGKKIEVSNRDVEAAVVPLQFLDRVRTTIKNFGERLGFGNRQATRGRARSSVGGGIEVSPSPSSASAHTNVSEKRHAHIEHSPLSPTKSPKDDAHSLAEKLQHTADAQNRELYSMGTGSHPELTSKTTEHNDGAALPLPEHIERPNTSSASSGSMATARQPEVERGRAGISPPQSPILPGTRALDSPSGPPGGIARRIFKSVREKSAARSTSSRAGSSDRGTIEPIDTHSEPSLAISQASAIGHHGDFVTTSPTSSARHSPLTSRPLSAVSSPSHDRLYPSLIGDTLSRTSSRGSIRSIPSLPGSATYGSRNASRTASRAGSPSPVKVQPRIPLESSDEQWQRAQDDFMQRRLREVNREETPSSPFDERACPPSPDDQIEERTGSRRMPPWDGSSPESSQEPSPIGRGAQLPAAMASSTSDFGSSVSMSNPSIPSVLSQTSSRDLLNEDEIPQESAAKTPTDLLSSDDTIDPKLEYRQVDHEGYEAVEDVIQSDDEDDSSDDSDGGIVMSRRKSAARLARLGDPELYPRPTKSKSPRRSSDKTLKTESL